MAFSRQQLPAARAFVDSVYSAGGARIGRGSRHPATWSDAYTLRVANVWQRQAAAGRELSLQEARRGPGYTARVRAEQLQAAGRGRILRGGLEHPRQKFVGPLDRGRPDLEGSVGFYARQYRSEAAARRWAEDRISSDRVQVTGYGRLLIGYAGDVPPGWRVLYTGARYPGFWDDAVSPRAFDMFEHVTVWEVRWGPGIGD